MKARGQVRKILQKVGQIQNLVGMAEGLHYNDRSQGSFEKAQAALRQAFEICVDLTGQYDPIPDDAAPATEGAA